MPNLRLQKYPPHCQTDRAANIQQITNQVEEVTTSDSSPGIDRAFLTSSLPLIGAGRVRPPSGVMSNLDARGIEGGKRANQETWPASCRGQKMNCPLSNFGLSSFYNLSHLFTGIFNLNHKLRKFK